MNQSIKTPLFIKDFNENFDRIQKALPFNEAWANGTGYFDHAVQGKVAPVLAVGELAKSTARDGRKIIFIGTPFHNVVVFERYTTDKNIVVWNASNHFESICGRGMTKPINENSMYYLFDIPALSDECNLGARLGNAFGEIMKVAESKKAA